jgi:DNA invertase Pin-like site-specific DNA recombinase
LALLPNIYINRIYKQQNKFGGIKGEKEKMETGKYIGGDNYIEEVAAYIRVSTQEQKLHGISLEAQVEKLTEYAEKNGMKIVKFYKDEGVSGRKLIKNRPALQEMIHDAEKGKFKRIIFIKLDRFFRSVAEYHECMKRISPVVWTTTEEKYDLSTAQGRMLVNMKLK